jgi:hypothetical protein
MAEGRVRSPQAAALVAASLGLLALRLVAAQRVGFGDSEALYASYALHPQPAYLDHPGLVGMVARLVGAGTAPSPGRAHFVTAIASTLVPWVMAFACRAAGASPRRALGAALVFAFVPEIAVGLFALTPDLLLALAWLGALACAAAGLRGRAGSAASAAAFAAAGLLAGVSATAKVTGALLTLALALAYASRAARAHARTAAPWAGLAAGAIVVAPVAAFEARAGWPMLTHRLVATQQASGLSLRNAGALLGGQLVYLSPLVAVLVALGAREAWTARGRGDDATASLLFCAFVVPLAVLAPLCLWSRVAEPHWIAPALLSLGPALARSERPPGTRLVVAAGAMGAAMVASVHAWVLVPAAQRLAPESADPRLDISSELYGWPDVVRAVRRQAAAEWTPGSARGDVVVVGPHWVICAQLEAALRGELPVGCDTPVRDDFDTWWPRARWRTADSIVWVSDARFGPPPDLPDYATGRTGELRVMRGGRIVRVFTIATMTRRARG